MTLARIVFFSLLVGTWIGLAGLAASVLGARAGWTPVTAALFACVLGGAPWLGVCVGNAVPGFVIRMLARDPARAVLPVRGDIESGRITARSAIAVTIRDEPMGVVLPALGRLLDGLAAAGVGDRFAAFVLSDTQDPARGAAEAAAIARFRHPVRYRRRADNAGFKAGNVMDFLDHHAEGFDFAVMLDADSEMSAAAVLRLVRHHAGGAVPRHRAASRRSAGRKPPRFPGCSSSACARACGSGRPGRLARAYWGHNAIIRIAPFRAHAGWRRCRAASAVLSHDQVEAARLRAAGWGVCVWAEEAGSRRPSRRRCRSSCAGTRAGSPATCSTGTCWARPGLRPMGRWQLRRP